MYRIISIVVSALLCGIVSTGDYAAAQTRAFFIPVDIFKGLPPTRVGSSSSRGCALTSRTTSAKSKKLRMHTISAKGTALSSNAQPTLYWYINTDIDAEAIEITLFNEKKLSNLGEPIRLPGKVRKGLQAVSLRQHKIALLADEVYRWNVAIICNLKDRSGDVVASGTIMHVPFKKGGPELKACNSILCKLKVFASRGYWFDAIHLVSSKFGKSTPSPESIKLRNRLLKEVGLGSIAAN